MKKIMGGYFHNTDSEIKDAWNSGDLLFVFDTNVLINLYSYAEKTRSEFIGVLEQIKDRAWIPYHVCLEYQRRRLAAISASKKVFLGMSETLSKFERDFESKVTEFGLMKRIPELNAETEKFKKELKSVVDLYKAKIEEFSKKQIEVNGDDKILEGIDKIFDDRCGEAPENQKWLDSLYEEGEVRYKNKFPPGYKDSDKKNQDDNIFMYAGLIYKRDFSDLIIWKQILKKCEDSAIKKLIFVTDDGKEDWWRIERSNGEKVIGARPELRQEVFDRTSVDFFHMYSSLDFLQNAREILGLKVSEESISEVENTSLETGYRKVKLSSDILNVLREKIARSHSYETSVDHPYSRSRIEHALIANKQLFDGVKGQEMNEWKLFPDYLKNLKDEQKKAAALSEIQQSILSEYLNEDLINKIERSEDEKLRRSVERFVDHFEDFNREDE